ncbi:MAG TPA: hypothetical protein ENN50_04310 [Prosthecochloris aestuarii]|uniref:Uncharacterized protein n=1 Tax=Prosthecochloris aestuarii TaxID=1102 RepID=A0A831SSH4_PROAE|nr:hypothetical protein [Prosthecochloris aestuarii]
MSIKKIKDMGLAEFVAGLISETFEAITASQEEQLRREADMRAAESMSPAEFRRHYLDENDIPALVDHFCDELFGQNVKPGMTYQPPGRQGEELPAFGQLLGTELKERIDYAKQQGSRDLVLTQKGAQDIRHAVLLRYIEHQQDLILKVLNNGLSRIVVDSGKIFSRVSFSVTEHEGSGSSGAPGSSSASATTSRTIVSRRSAVLNRLSRNRSNLVMPGVEFRVRQADDTDPQTSSADLYGEVEIHFRTVS